MEATIDHDVARRLAAALRGTVVPAVLTPMSSDGTVDRAALERYATALASRPIGGVAVWAHTGRALHLPSDTRAAILRTWRAATALPIVAGAGVPVRDAPATTDEANKATVAMAERAAGLGADVIMVYPPRAFADDQRRTDLLLDLHDAVAAATELPVLGFHLHAAAGGYPYDRTFLTQLLARPAVIGVKTATLDRAIDCQETLGACLDAGKLAVTGEDRMLGPSFTWGAETALVGIAAAALDATSDVAAAWMAGSMADFVSSSQRLDRFAAVTFDRPIEGYVQRMMWVAAQEGLIPAEAAHDPFGPPRPRDERGKVVAAFDAIRAQPLPT
jgi:4-hydroxy-tetrahydrodipicolinate synthase